MIGNPYKKRNIYTEEEAAKEVGVSARLVNEWRWRICLKFWPPIEGAVFCYSEADVEKLKHYFRRRIENGDTR